MSLHLPRNEYRISITSLCNMRCEYCHNEGNTSQELAFMQPDFINELICQSCGFGLQSVRLTGGEPLIHPSIKEICQNLRINHGLEVGINTNCIEMDTLLNLVNNDLLQRVVVGIDYFNASVSKRSSIGIPSAQILNHILCIKRYGIDVSISTVYDDNYCNIKELVSWCIENRIRIKILERVNQHGIYSKENFEYEKMGRALFEDFKLEIKYNQWEEKEGYSNGERIVSMFPSLCRLGRCDLCHQIHLRITCDQKLKSCIQNNSADMLLESGLMREQIKNYVTKLHLPRIL